MAGLVPAIHVFELPKKFVDARDKRGHDGCGRTARRENPLPPCGGGQERSIAQAMESALGGGASPDAVSLL